MFFWSTPYGRSRRQQISTFLPSTFSTPWEHMFPLAKREAKELGLEPIIKGPAGALPRNRNPSLNICSPRGEVTGTRTHDSKGPAGALPRNRTQTFGLLKGPTRQPALRIRTKGSRWSFRELPLESPSPKKVSRL